MTDTASAFAVASIAGLMTAMLMAFGMKRGLRAKPECGARFVWMLWVCGVVNGSAWLIIQLIPRLGIGAAVQRYWILFWLVWLVPWAFIVQRSIRRTR